MLLLNLLTKIRITNDRQILGPLIIDLIARENSNLIQFKFSTQPNLTTNSTKPIMTLFSQTLFLLFLLLILLTFPTTSKTSFLVLLADDLGYGDPNYMGGVSTTPYLNDFSRSNHSMRMDNFHSGSSICSPSRASLISGRFPDRDCVSSVNDQVRLPRKNWPFRLDMPSMGHDALRVNYETLFLGKWNLGSLKDRHPGMLGFKHWKVSLQNMLTFDPSCVCDSMECMKDCNAHDTCKGGGYRGQCFSSTAILCDLGHYKGPYPKSPLLYECDLKQGVLGGQTNEPPHRFPSKSLNAVHLIELFGQFLDTLSPEVPFLTVVAFYEPHEPFTTTPQIREACRKGTGYCKRPVSNVKDQDFYGCISHIDNALKLAIETLKAKGRYEDTIVVFASDNGPENTGVGAGSPGGLAGRKRQLLEGGVRVPGIVHWPRVIQRNYVVGPKDTNRLTALIDLRPTFFEVMARENPTQFMNTTDVQNRMDGVSWVPLLQNPNADFARLKPYFICDPGRCGSFAYYMNNWKIIAPLKQGTGPSALYDLSVDFREQVNKASKKFLIYNQAQFQGRKLAEQVMSERRRYCLR